MTSFLNTVSKINSRRHAVPFLELGDEATRHRSTGDPRLDHALAAQR